MLEQHRVSSIVKKQRTRLNDLISFIQDLLMSLSYVAVMMLIIFFLGVVYALPNKM